MALSSLKLTTAGKRAPKLILKEHVEAMKRESESASITDEQPDRSLWILPRRLASIFIPCSELD